MAKKKRGSGSRRGARAERLAWASSPGFRAGVVVAAALAGLGAAGWGAVTVHARAGEILASSPTGIEIEWPTLGGAEQTWLGAQLREQIVSRVEAQLAGQPLDARSMAAVGRMLTESGWFDAEPRVERTGDSTIRVSGVWRVPACAVRTGGREYPLDWKGRAFPVDYAAGSSGLRVLVGVRAPVPLDSVGTLNVMDAWPGEDVEAGLGLLAPLLREPFAGQVAGVDVSAYFGEGRLSIVTDRDTRVVWGGRYGEFVPGEATTEEKMLRLRKASSNPMYQQRIDSGADRLDISGEHLILDRSGTP